MPHFFLLLFPLCKMSLLIDMINKQALQKHKHRRADEAICTTTYMFVENVNTVHMEGSTGTHFAESMPAVCHPVLNMFYFNMTLMF